MKIEFLKVQGGQLFVKNYKVQFFGLESIFKNCGRNFALKLLEVLKITKKILQNSQQILKFKVTLQIRSVTIKRLLQKPLKN